MKFRSKMDRTFKMMMSVALGIIALATMWPVAYELFYTNSPDYLAIWIMIAIIFSMYGFSHMDFFRHSLHILR